MITLIVLCLFSFIVGVISTLAGVLITIDLETRNRDKSKEDWKEPDI